MHRAAQCSKTHSTAQHSTPHGAPAPALGPPASPPPGGRPCTLPAAPGLAHAPQPPTPAQGRVGKLSGSGALCHRAGSGCAPTTHMPHPSSSAANELGTQVAAEAGLFPTSYGWRSSTALRARSYDCFKCAGSCQPWQPAGAAVEHWVRRGCSQAGGHVRQAYEAGTRKLPQDLQPALLALLLRRAAADAPLPPATHRAANAPTPHRPPACRGRQPEAPPAGAPTDPALAPPAPLLARLPAGTARSRGKWPTACCLLWVGAWKGEGAGGTWAAAGMRHMGRTHARLLLHSSQCHVASCPFQLGASSAGVA